MADPASPGTISPGTATCTTDMDDSTEMTHGANQIQQELPFLVTHWLANYGNNNNIVGATGTTASALERDRQEAIARIRRATTEIASAFRTLGAYGTTFRPSFESSSLHQCATQNSSFADVSRRHAGLAPTHLENLALSVTFNNATANATAHENSHANLLLQATSSTEALLRGKRQAAATDAASGSVAATVGRTLQDAIVIDEDETAQQGAIISAASGLLAEGGSILQNPALIAAAQPGDGEPPNGKDGNNSCLIMAERKADSPPTLKVKAANWDIAHQTAEAMREFLTLRENVQSTKNEIHSLETSLTLQQRTLAKLTARFNRLVQDTTILSGDKSTEMDEINAEKQGCDRVISQLQRKLVELKQSQKSSHLELARLERKARSLDKTRRSIAQNYHDPFIAWKGPLSKESRIGGCRLLQTVMGRQHGLSRSRFVGHQPMKMHISSGVNIAHLLECRKDIMATRLSHALTINTHMNCPVYCLRFDRTGRYVITGADDYLIKVFYLGAAQSCQRSKGGNRLLKCNYGANFRGATLVCSLRGHAGVINDIDVSSDNCFLATASVDGDVRVWGLNDGCPVAILRGHVGGANMVSWSTLTPYRLVTTGSDGFARVWDIREACLKRYGKFVSRREEYKLVLTEEEKRTRNENETNHYASRSAVPNLLPPIPVRGETSSQMPGTSTASAMTSEIPGPPPPLPPLPAPVGRESTNGSIAVPPLPDAVPPLGQGADAGIIQNDGAENDSAEGIAPGQFVANDMLDEGVKLLSKYQHGSNQNEQQQGPGTRSRRTAINVICVARSPLGNQFATGSDDGICRVWQDYDDDCVAIIDKRSSCIGTARTVEAVNPPRSGMEHKPLVKLMGHVSTITDLAYSHAGDRILSASQKDGVVRIWNIGNAMTSGSSDKRVTQIVIKLTDPSSKKSSQPVRRRPGNATRNPPSKVSCDVAVWTHDDSQVVTSQCVLVKQNGSEIQPGSQFLFMWDSRSGHCLMGVSGAHTMQCPVLIPHPNDASILCTAAADGSVKVWDWGQGKCIFTHQNRVEYGPPDPNNPDKVGGYLDGAFSPDGTVIVLTDDTGQITVLDSIAKQDNPSNSGEDLSWMREQYFANDYYDLVYDRSGYCIEKGSERPPHLAPKGARCTHNGTPYSDEINEAFRSLVGPLPLPENSCRWRREDIRATRVKTDTIAVPSPSPAGVRIGVREFDPLSTIVIKGVGHVEVHDGIKSRHYNGFTSTEHPQESDGTRRNTGSSRLLSANYRYLDYDDLLRREGDEDDPDSDDEEFEPVARGRRLGARGDENGDESDDDDNIDDFSDESDDNGQNRRRRRATSRTTEDRRERAQRRAHRRGHSDFIEIDSDDEMIAQFVSANTTPKGPYLRDYQTGGHLWKMKSASDAKKINRKWLQREESDSSYFGKKTYAPQLGDLVVYIPRAHYETIKEFPSFSPPWQHWPAGTAWPVVRCFVRGVRYRFPYEDYFRKGAGLCKSVVAILTLEVTGIPELSDEREFPWPKPAFVEPTRPFVFELSVFENPNSDYVVPESLYTSRLKALEDNIRAQEMRFEGLEVDLYYDNNQNVRRQDAEMEVWPGTIADVVEEDALADAHLQGSGFGVLHVEGVGGDNYSDYISPWEVNTEGANLSRPCLHSEEKTLVLEALNFLLQKGEIYDHFSMPVDEERYSDYGAMIESPMDLLFVKRRLNENFYGCRLGVAFDLRLIRDNCIKYNTAENEISETAVAMCAEFEGKVLSEEERSQIISEEDFDKIQRDQSEGRQSSTMRIRLSARRIQEASEASASNGARYSLRDRTGTQGQSSLENLPVPENASARRRGLRRDSVADNATRGRQSLRSQDRTEVLGEVARLRSGRRGDDINADVIGSRARGRTVAVQDSRNTRRSRRLDENHSHDDVGGNNDSPSRRTRSNLRSTDSHPRSFGQNDDEEDAVDSATETRDFPAIRTTRRDTSVRGTRASSRRRDRFGDDNAFEGESDDIISENGGDNNDSEAGSHYSEVGEDASSVGSDSLGFEATPSAVRKRKRSSPRSKRNIVLHSAPKSPGRRSSRKAANKRASYEEIDSDEEEYADEYREEEDDEEEEEEEDTKVRPTRSSRGKKPAALGEDYLSFSDEESYHEESPRKNRNKRRKLGSASSSGQAAKKKKTNKSILSPALPNLKEWPEIPVGDITNVTNELLRRISECDTLDAFAEPVAEAFPSIAEEYARIIKEPMDLRTIEEERKHVYRSIKMLQNDLVLMFQNCCTFNEIGSEYWDYARERWEGLNNLFELVCHDLNVLLPRRWK